MPPKLKTAPETPEQAQARAKAEAVPISPWPLGDGSIAQMLSTAPEPRKWYIKDRLLLGRGAILTGIGGVSKTTMLYHFGFAGPLGRLPWEWEVETKGKAVLFLAEDTADDVHHTLAALTAHMDDEDRAALAKNLIVFPMAGQDVRLLSLDGQTIFENMRAMGLVEKLRQLGKVVFIGLDPALALTEGDEMNQAHQRYLGQFVDKLAIETGACVVLVTHASKASANTDEIASHQSRGAGGITDAVRAEFVMRTMTQKEAMAFGIDDQVERKAHVQVVVTKGNKLPAEAFAPLWLRRGHGGSLVPANISPGQSGEPRVSLIDTAIFKALVDMSATSTPLLAEWRDKCVEMGLIRGPSPGAIKKQMERTVQVLIKAGLIKRGFARGMYLPAEQDGEA